MCLLTVDFATGNNMSVSGARPTGTTIQLGASGHHFRSPKPEHPAHPAFRGWRSIVLRIDGRGIPGFTSSRTGASENRVHVVPSPASDFTIFPNGYATDAIPLQSTSTSPSAPRSSSSTFRGVRGATTGAPVVRVSSTPVRVGCREFCPGMSARWCWRNPELVAGWGFGCFSALGIHSEVLNRLWHVELFSTSVLGGVWPGVGQQLSGLLAAGRHCIRVRL